MAATSQGINHHQPLPSESMSSTRDTHPPILRDVATNLRATINWGRPRGVLGLSRLIFGTASSMHESSDPEFHRTSLSTSPHTQFCEKGIEVCKPWSSKSLKVKHHHRFHNNFTFPTSYFLPRSPSFPIYCIHRYPLSKTPKFRNQTPHFSTPPRHFHTKQQTKLFSLPSPPYPPPLFT